MALQTLAGYKTFAGITSTDATRDAALGAMLAELEAAVLKKIGTPIEQATYTVYLDAPPREKLRLPVAPVTAVASVKYAPGSKGEPSKFDGTTLLTPYTDYILDVDQPDGTTSRSGLLIRTNDIWGGRWMYEPTALAPQLRADWRAVQVVYTAGYASVPADLVMVMNLAASKLYQMRKLGGQAQSASLNGASFSLAQAATAQSVLADPTIRDILSKYGDGGYRFA